MKTKYIAWLIALIITAMLCSSCTSQDKFNRIGNNHLDWLAELCGEKFPIDTTSVQEDSDTIPANNIDYSKTIDSLVKVAEIASKLVKHDTIYQEKECNELLQNQQRVINSQGKALNKLRGDYKPCKPWFIRRTITITKEDQTKLYKANLEIEKLKEDVGRKESQRNWLFGFLLISVGIIFIVKR